MLAADGPVVGLVCVLLLLCVILSALLPERGSRRPIVDSGAHIANVRPIVRPYDWQTDDDLRDMHPFILVGPAAWLETLTLEQVEQIAGDSPRLANGYLTIPSELLEDRGDW